MRSLSQKSQEECLCHMQRIVGTLKRAVDVLDTDQLAEGLDHAVCFDAMTCEIGNELKLWFSHTLRELSSTNKIIFWQHKSFYLNLDQKLSGIAKPGSII